MRFFLLSFVFISSLSVFSQDLTKIEKEPSATIDSLYREDQFYFGINFNRLLNKPGDFKQNKLSTGYSFGFLRDMPLNKNRTIAIAVGMGASYKNYNQNLVIKEVDQKYEYSFIDIKENFKKNKFSHLLIDFPVEFRWRTSTPESYKFWRIYGGFKFSYLLYDKSVFDGETGRFVVTNNTDFNKLIYGAYISSGYNTWNVYAYYGLNSLFKDVKSENKVIDMNSLNVGVIFYIL
jgi:hypothetical protein